MPTTIPPPPPTFTVVMPAYRSEETIERAIRSVLEQTLPPLEILVIDDGSDDRTGDVAAAIGGPVRVIRQPNGGTASARNRGIREARGDVICFLDADDRYEPHRLEAIAAKLLAEPQLDGVVTDAAMVEPARTVLASSFWPEGARRDRLDIRAKVIFCALAVRRETMQSIGPFDPAFHLLEDVEMWHRLICNGHGIGFVDDPSYVYLINPSGKTQSARHARGELELARIFARYALALRTPHGWRPRLALRAARHARRSVEARLHRV